MKNAAAAMVTQIQNHFCRARSPGQGRRPQSIQSSLAAAYKNAGSSKTQRALSCQAAPIRP